MTPVPFARTSATTQAQKIAPTAVGAAGTARDERCQSGERPRAATACRATPGSQRPRRGPTPGCPLATGRRDHRDDKSNLGTAADDDGVTHLVGWLGRTTAGTQRSGTRDVADLPPVRELLLPDG
jgi:hypothetical protein